MKYMNRITLCVSLCMLALFCSCDEERDIRWTTVEIDVRYPSDLSGISVESETFEFRNITSGMVTSFTTRKGITLPEGLYDCSYEAAITYQTADSTIHTSLSGYNFSFGRKFKTGQRRVNNSDNDSGVMSTGK